MKEFWNDRYSMEEYVYGKEPNVFFQEEIEKLLTGKALFVAEGEGRNAVYAAQKGWDVYAFDISEQGREKALNLATEKEVNINYSIASVLDVALKPESFDLVVFVFTHFPEGIRNDAFIHVLKSVKPGGHVIFECFSKEHLNYNAHNNSGGPREESMLYSEKMVRELFKDFQNILLETKVVMLNEGRFHDGQGSVIRFVGKRTNGELTNDN